MTHCIVKPYNRMLKVYKGEFMTNSKYAAIVLDLLALSACGNLPEINLSQPTSESIEMVIE